MMTGTDNHRVNLTLTVSQIELVLSLAETAIRGMAISLTPRELREPEVSAFTKRVNRLTGTLTETLEKYKDRGAYVPAQDT